MASLPTVRHTRGAGDRPRTASSRPTDQSIGRRRKDAVAHVLGVSLLLAMPLLAVSWWTGIQSGQYAINLLLTAVSAVAATMFARRDRLSASVLVRFTWALWTVVFLASYAEMGFASVAPVLFFFPVAVAALATRQAETIALALVTVGGLVGVFVLKLLGAIDPIPEERPLEEYLDSPAEWLFNMTALCFAGYVVYVAVVKSAFETRRAADQYRESVAESMVLLARLRDDDTGDHIERCGRLGEMLHDECRRRGVPGCEKIDVHDFSRAVQLHDIGKVGVADDILLKPGRLTPDEFDAMKKHTLVGARIIEQIQREQELESDPLLALAREIALSHHENWDGTGYPHGISAGEIPLSARMMAVIDVYDAMRCERPYKAPLGHGVAIDEIRTKSGLKFDPVLAAAFLAIEDDLLVLYDD